ncbi:hypothetical protein ACFVDH_26505, partial [Streptomyces sp. NPDC057674]
MSDDMTTTDTATATEPATAATAAAATAGSAPAAVGDAPTAVGHRSAGRRGQPRTEPGEGWAQRSLPDTGPPLGARQDLTVTPLPGTDPPALAPPHGTGSWGGTHE